MIEVPWIYPLLAVAGMGLGFLLGYLKAMDKYKREEQE